MKLSAGVLTSREMSSLRQVFASHLGASMSLRIFFICFIQFEEWHITTNMIPTGCYMMTDLFVQPHVSGLTPCRLPSLDGNRLHFSLPWCNCQQNALNDSSIMESVLQLNVTQEVAHKQRRKPSTKDFPIEKLGIHHLAVDSDLRPYS